MKQCRLKQDCCYCKSSTGNIYPSNNCYHADQIKCTGCDRHLKWISKKEFKRAIALLLRRGERKNGW